jgi:hypothetical protein
MVAGACNHPNCLVLPFSLDLIRVAALAGAINGWAEPAILDAYGLERQPVTEQVSRYAMNTFAKQSKSSALLDDLEAPGQEGDAAPARIGREAYELNVGQFCCGGLNFGYFYDASPIITLRCRGGTGFQLV